MDTTAEINVKRLVDLFCSLVKIDAPSFKERDMADAVSQILFELGFQVNEDDAGSAIGGNCGNLYASIPGQLAGPPLLFSVHLDTVEPSIGKQAVIKNEQIICSHGDTILGADDLAGLTAILEAVKTAAEHSIPHRALEILMSVAEEAHLKGSTHLQRNKLKAVEAYVLDTSGAPGLAVLQAPGHIEMTFHFYGRASHAGIAPEEGISALQAAARGVASLQFGRIDPETTANIGRIEGGGETNIIADYCKVTAECRSLNYDRLIEHVALMRAKMEAAALQTGAKLEIEERLSYLPYEISPDKPVVKRFVKACQILGLQTKLISSCGGSDNNVLFRNGIEGIVLSCGMNNVHSCKEMIRIQDLADTARLVLTLIGMQ